LSSRGASPEGRNGFARNVDEARRTERSEARRSERKRDDEPDARDPSSVDNERRPEETDEELALRQRAEATEGLDAPELPTFADALAASDSEQSAESAGSHKAAPSGSPAAPGPDSPVASAQAAFTGSTVARPVSLTQPALRGNAGPKVSQAAPTEPLGTPLPIDPVAPQGEAPAPLDPAAGQAESQPQNTEGAVRVSEDPATPAPLPRAGAESASQGVEGAARRDQASPVQPKAGPVPPPPPSPSPEQAANVLRQFRLHLTPGMRQATIQLQPAALGRISIRITLRNGEARTEIRAESAETLEALERHVPELRAALQNQGLETGDLELNLGFGQESSDTSRPSKDRTGAQDIHNDGPEATLASDAITRKLLSETGVDTYA